MFGWQKANTKNNQNKVLKPTPKSVLLLCTLIIRIRRVFFAVLKRVIVNTTKTLALSLLALALMGIYTYTRAYPPAYAATASTFNFQARLMTGVGSIVPDGYYNVQFKLYDGGTQGGPAGPGAANAGTNLWTETYYDSDGAGANPDNRVQVKAGYLTVNLGSQTAFPGTINWDQELWLTMNIGGTTHTATPTWDGEMLTPTNTRIKLTAVPYAFKAAQAANVKSADTTTASTNSDAVSITSGNASGTTSNSGTITIDTGTATQTTGQLLFGTTNASALTLGRTGITTSIQGTTAITGTGTALTVTNSASIGNTLTVGGAAQAGLLVVNDGSGYTAALRTVALTDNRIIELPDESGVLCIQGSTNCGFITGSAVDFIQNQNAAQQTANYWISGTAQADTSVLTPLLDTATAVALNIGTTNATVINLNQNTTLATGKTLRVVGDTYTNIEGYPSPTEGQITYDQTNDQLLVYNATLGKWMADKSDAILVAASNSSQADKNAADYVADGEIGDGQTTLDGDQVEINQALTAGAGKKVILLAGTYTADATILIPNNTTLAGVGAGTLIQLADIDVSDNLIENTDQVTGTGVVIKDLRLDGQDALNTAGAQQHGIYLNNMGDGSGATAVKGATITGVVVKDFNRNGIYLFSSNNNIVSNNTTGSNWEGIYLRGSSNNSVSGNITQNNYNSGLLLHSSTKNSVTGNVSEGNEYCGLMFTSSSSDNTVTGNNFKDNVYSGAYIGNSQNNIIANNVMSGSNEPLVIVSSSKSSITGNYVQGGGAGIGVSSSNTIIVSQNNIYDAGGATDNNAIRINDSDNTTVTGNNITDTSATTTNYAININNASSDNNYLADNRFSSTPGTSTINDLGTGTVYSNQPLSENGGSITTRTANSTTAFQVQNAAGTSVLTVDTENQQLQVRNKTDAAVIGADIFGADNNTCTGTNWTDTGVNTWAHTGASYNPLVCSSPAISAGQTYEVRYTVTGAGANRFTSTAIGGVNGAVTTSGDATMRLAITTTSTASFQITGYDSLTVQITSIKAITNSTSSLAVKSSVGTTVAELRVNSSNLGFGLSSLQSNSTGTNNTAIGLRSLQSNTIGGSNVAVGNESLLAMGAGYENTAMGYQSLRNNMSGNYNTAVGTYSLAAGSGGSFNTAVGWYSLYSNDGSGNTALGEEAAFGNLTGDNNTAVGSSALMTNSTGSLNTALGYSSGFRDSTTQFRALTNLQSSTVIGAYAQAYANNVVALGGQGADAVRVGIGTGAPTGTLSVEPFRYNTGTVSTASGSGAVTGSGTTFTAAMVGSRIYIGSNSTTVAPYSGTITGYTSATSITVSPNVGFTSSGRSYYINYVGLQVATDGRVGIGTTAPTADLSFGGSADRTVNVTANGVNATGYDLTVKAGAAGAGASAFSGGDLILQGGDAAGTGNANGGDLLLSGGAGTGTGVKGLVVIDTPTFATSATQNCGVDCTITQANVDATAAVIINATAGGLTVGMPDPTNNTAGRVVYVTAANGSEDFTLSVNGGGQGNEIAMRANTTATMIWNGNDWTAAGASSSTTLQAAYDNTLSSAGGAEIVLNNTATSNGLTVRNSATSPIIGGIFEAQSAIGSNLFSVNNNATEYATNGGAETVGASASAFPANTWDATTGGTVDRYTTTGDNIATGAASVRMQATAINHGARNRLSAALTSGLTYSVSFAIRGAVNFSSLQVLYSPDGSTSGTTQCSTAETVTSGMWTRISCTFIAGGSINSSNSILIRQTDATARTFYIDNLSVSINASATYASDGSVDDAGNFATNWTNYAASGTATMARDTATIYDTSASAEVTASATAGIGMRNNMSITPQINTQYLVSFYAYSSTTMTNSMAVGFLPAGGTSAPSGTAACTDYNTQTVPATTWTKITCLFSTTATAISDPDLVIYQTDASARVINIDALSITLNTNNANNVQIGGSNKGGPTTLFTLDRSDSAPIAANNEAYLGSMYYDTTTGRIQCYEADGWGACGSAPDNIVNLNPEYSGAVLNGTGVGTMTADLCANESGVLVVNTSLCSSGEAKNYYKWTSPQATQQTYSIYVSYQLPTTFKGFASDDTVQLTARVDNTTNASVTYEMFRSEGGAITQCGAGETAVTSSANVWQTVGINGNEATGCGFTSNSGGAFVMFKINVKANSNANAYVSTLTFTTTGK